MATVRDQQSLPQRPRGLFFRDLSVWSLILANGLTIGWAFFEGWPLSTVMWVYWGQSVILGLFWFVKIWNLDEFSTKDFKINDRSVQPTVATKVRTALFFLAHYGIFHAVYLGFLAGPLLTGAEDVPGIELFLLGSIFFVSQAFSFIYNRQWRTPGCPNIGTMMFYPYIRIVPMHLAIIFGGVLESRNIIGADDRSAVFLFLLLKSLADLAMYAVERRGFGDKPKAADMEIA